jgi:HlyD family secretion protein
VASKLVCAHAMKLKRSLLGYAPALLALLCACSSNDDKGTIHASGIIETEEVVVGPKVSGTVAAVYAREGSPVRAGDTLLRIDDTDLKIQVDAQRAAVDAANAGYRRLVKGSRPEDIDQAQQAMRQASLALDAAKGDVKRLEATITSGGVTEKMLSDARSREAISERALSGAQAVVRKLRNGATAEDLEVARAQVAGAEAALRAAQRRVEECVVTSPIDGVITRRGFDEGELIPAGGGAYTVSRTGRVRLKIYVAEDELGHIHLGDTAAVTIDTYADRSYPGTVSYISPTAEFTPKNVQTKDDRTKLVFEIWVEVENKDGALKSGLAAEAVLHDSTMPASEKNGKKEPAS